MFTVMFFGGTELNFEGTCCSSVSGMAELMYPELTVMAVFEIK